jgi:hypothetical protein
LEVDERSRLPFPAASTTTARDREVLVVSAKRASWVEWTLIVPDGEAGGKRGAKREVALPGTRRPEKMDLRRSLRPA